MSVSFTLPSHAKINLSLQILGKRPDGFHALRSLMLPISLADTLQFESLNIPRIEIECSDPSLPTNKNNLVRRAAELLQTRYATGQGARIYLQKHIPVGAGLGGGSSNASTTLIGLNRLWNLKLPEETLERIAAELGSDTAFFIRCHPALCEGRGEILTPFHFPTLLPLLLINFGFGSSTAWAYQHLECTSSSKFQVSSFSSQPLPSHLRLPLPLFQNDLEPPVFKKFPILQIAKKFLIQQPQVIAAIMCGSGSTLLALLKSKEEAETFRNTLIQRFGESLWIWIGDSIPSPL